MWDEITISAELKFNKKTFKFEGFVGHNRGKTEFHPEDNRAEPQDERLADNALMLIVQPYMTIQPYKNPNDWSFPSKGSS
jgi:hypothetical protein